MPNTQFALALRPLALAAVLTAGFLLSAFNAFAQSTVGCAQCTATRTIEENLTVVDDLSATNIDGYTENGGGLTWSLTGGVDMAFFTIDPNTGVLSFINPPDFETPLDANQDNMYLVQIAVTDPIGPETRVNFIVTVTDVAERVVVRNLNDAGPGSLRDALNTVAPNGIVVFDPNLAGGTIILTTGRLTIAKSVTVDGGGAPGLAVSGDNSSRIFEIGADITVSINDLVVFDGTAAPQGGGILNRGTLNLDRVVVRDNTENSAGPALFNLGGGGIYNADSSTLNLVDSTVSNNTSVNQPGGGIYGFFNSTINITRSTVSGNLSGDVGGGLRLLSNGNVINSTFSGNTSTAWHGGAIFHTDGNLTVTNSTFTENVAPVGTASGILVATFGAPANATLTNNVLEGNGGAFACAIEGGGAATITSGGSNIISDLSCNPNGTTDQSSIDALLGALADNGGPTLTHALGAGSPAIDAADAGDCPATDQRGVVRPQGAGCDVGAYEF